MITRRDFIATLGTALPAGGLISRAAEGTELPSRSRAPRSDSRPNVVLIIADDHGLQLGCYGDAHAHTPHLDQLASQGTRFRHAWCAQAVCSPARSSIYTGLYPHENGQLGLATFGYAVNGTPRNLVKMCSQAGYRTALLGKLHVNPESEFPFGQHWYPPETFSFQTRDVLKMSRAAEAFINEGDGQPFLLTVATPDPHLPWLDQSAGYPAEDDLVKAAPVPSWVGADSPALRKAAASYYNCVRRLDHGVGLLCDVLRRTGNWDNTLIISLADHGPQFARGKMTCYQGGLQIPLIVKPPGTGSRRPVSEALVSQIDIFPTVADYCGLPESAGGSGHSLRRLIEGPEAKSRDYLFAEWNASIRTFPTDYYPQRCVRNARFKLIRTLTDLRPSPPAVSYSEALHPRAPFEVWPGVPSPGELAASSPATQEAYKVWMNPPREELYDLQTDPDELKNLSANPEHASIRQELGAALDQWQAATRDQVRNLRDVRRVEVSLQTLT